MDSEPWQVTNVLDQPGKVQKLVTNSELGRIIALQREQNPGTNPSIFFTFEKPLQKPYGVPLCA